MKKLITVVSALLAALMVLVALGLPVNASDPEFNQTWYLDQKDHKQVPAVLVMEREDNGTQSGSVQISGGGDVKIWFADESAVPVDGVTFPAGEWAVYLKTTNWKSYCQVELGSGSPAGAFVPFSDQSTTYKSYADGGILEINITTTQQTVIHGYYLALKVTNIEPAGASRDIDTANGRSWVSSPMGEPGYPLPELAAGVLFGVGLAGVGTFIVIRKKQVKAATVK